uniref:RIIA-like protein n=1 Tax=Serratia phage Kevin TaxID=3161161 RepID=A0AAU8KZ40_9CAUD
MRQQQKEHFTKQSSSIAGQTFGVELSAKLFETVYGNMYRYKEAACTRELLCNMLDSHEMRDRSYRIIPSHYASVLSIPQRSISKFLAPKGTKPVVHLPDELEPWLEMRDYGIGLSLEQIIGDAIPAEVDELLIQGNMVVKDDSVPDGAVIIGEPGFYDGRLVFRSPENNEIIRGPGLYTTLFRSTKAEDNDMIGAFGLGSKSPFAVTDTFTVESRYEGKVYRFLMYLNSNRIPCCDMVTKDLETRDPKPDNTEEYNGLTVRVPVKNGEYGRYANELKRLGRVMEEKNLPEVENDRYFDGFTSIDRSNRINNTYVQPDKNGEHFAVMGGVSYPIDTKQLPTHLCAVLSRFPTTYTFFGIGELNVPPSREDLDYGEFTRAALEESLETLRNSIVDASVHEVIAAQRQGPLASYYAKMRYKDLYGDSFLVLLNEKVPVDPRFNMKGYFTVPGYDPVINREYVQGLSDYPDLINTKEKFYRMTMFTSWNREDGYTMDVSLFHKKSPYIVIMDDPKAHVQKCKTLATKNGRDVLLVVPDPNLTKVRNSKLGKLYTNSKEMRERVKKWCGVKKDMDYLAFADAFAEYFEGIVDPSDIKFTSELDYDRLVVEGNLGIMQVRYTKGSYSNMSFEGMDMQPDAIVKVAETGKRMVYIEMSGHSIISEINGEVLNAREIENMWNLMKQMKSPSASDDHVKDKGNEWYSEDAMLSNHLYMVRRKAVPFLKRNSQYFVPFQEVVAEFIETYKSMFTALELEGFSGKDQVIRNYIGRHDYYLWICQQLKNDELYQKFHDIQNKFRRSLLNSQACNKHRSEILEGRAYFYRYHRSMLQEFLESYSKYGSVFQDDVYGFKKYNKLVDAADFLLQKTARKVLGLESTDALLSSNNGSRRGRIRSEAGRKDQVKIAIEKYLIAQYVAASYKPVMGNKLLGKSQFMKTVLGDISPGV